MHNFHNDQAAGLRRIMSAPKPRVVSIISACLETTQPRIMTNLAASLQMQGQEVLIMHASQHSRDSQYALTKAVSIYDICQSNMNNEKAVKVSPYAFSVAKLANKNQQATVDETLQLQANQRVQQLAEQFDMILVDVSMNDEGKLALPILNESEIIIQLSRNPASIKQAYAVIKLLCSQLGRRSFGIIVSDADNLQAEIVFKNIQQVAKRFLQIELEFFGAIPNDDHLVRATKLGRTVIDAFPKAKVSAALSHIAKKFGENMHANISFKQVSYR
ncbi:MAG TPA: MotR [Methylotenera sp.]|mgnify:CR=1 FL=1|nr:MotR [Methylotenera sp.]HPH04946.1 MotR [Methylotenera sp.]HPN02204.1 MotR [Methylotenera sp.]